MAHGGFFSLSDLILLLARPRSPVSGSSLPGYPFIWMYKYTTNIYIYLCVWKWFSWCANSIISTYIGFFHMALWTIHTYKPINARPYYIQHVAYKIVNVILFTCLAGGQSACPAGSKLHSNNNNNSNISNPGTTAHLISAIGRWLCLQSELTIYRCTERNSCGDLELVSKIDRNLKILHRQIKI